MSISPGTRFGSYEVVEPIGAGGMGEVYRARDTTLGRDVALKVLPASFSNDAMRVARFEQEAKTLASLSHTNIAHIYGLERSDGRTGIVMELVDGETLADRLAQGPIPVDEALRIATQIADALEAAHERAIVHRDLKPANVKLKPDGMVKVLDFGIAKALDPRFLTGPGPAALTTPAMTEAGMILGTAAYMSPEQARGKFVDQRTDIWAFGCVLYEMLTGKPAFLSEDVTSTLARVLEVPANLAALPASVAPSVRRTLELCLEKDARKRIADIRDAKLALAGTFATGAPAQPLRRRALSVAAAVAAAALLASAATWLLEPSAAPEQKLVTRFDYAMDPLTGVTSDLSLLDISPSGDFVAVNNPDGIYVRRTADPEVRKIPGVTGGAADVTVSPDGHEVAYFRAPPIQLVKVAVDGGAPVVLVDGVTNPSGLSWNADGTILYGQADGIWRVSRNGGKPERIVKLEAPEQAYGPRLLPGGQWLLFTLTRATGANRWNEAEIVIQSLATGERRVLRAGGFDARYLPTGHVVYMFQNVLFASRFDAKTLKLDEERVALVPDVLPTAPPTGGGGNYSVANNGTLVYLPTEAAGTYSRPQRSVTWVDRTGKATALPLRPDDYTMARLSPDGTRIALVVGSLLPASDPPPDIYVFDVKNENLSQLTFNPQADDGPVWSRDGSRIYYRSFVTDGAVGEVYVLPTDGGTPERVAGSDNPIPLPWSISADGGTLLLVDATTFQDVDLAVLKIGKDKSIRRLLDPNQVVSEPSLSPNGKWLAYYQVDQATSIAEVNIRPYPDVRQQRRPVGRGLHPVFSADGSEIFFFDGDGLSVAPVEYSPFRVGAPRKLFRGQYWYGVGGPDGTLGRSWDVDPKNDRFLMITMPDRGAGDGPTPAARLSVVLNWFDELRQRVPKR